MAAFVLLAAAILQITHRRAATSRSIPDLASLLGQAPAGWTARDEPLGPTEALTAESLKLLELDGYVYRVYTKGQTFFSIYVAYWRESSEAAPAVLAHLPDHCWISNGMKCLEYTNATTLGNLPPAEWRLFATPQDQRLQVAYWLWDGGRPFDFGHGLISVYDDREGFNRSNLSTQAKWWLERAVHGSREQVFIRWVANVPLAELVRQPEVARFVRSAASIGSR